MKNKTLLITGADGALGRVVAKKLLDEGWCLYASVLNEKSLHTIAELFPEEINKKLFATITDLSKEEDVKAFITSAKDIFGLIHLAGGYIGGASIAEYSSDDFDFLFNLNAKPTFLLLKELLPLLKNNNEGTIITIAAKPAIKQTKMHAVYAASKSATLTLTMASAEECRPYQIRVNAIVPDTLQTKNNLSWASEEQFQKFTKLEDVADTISFLVSEKGKGITGMAIPMFGKLNT